MQMSRSTLKLPAILLAVFCAAGVANLGRAEGESDLSIDEMVDLADEVVIGQVVASDARWRGKKIVTTATLRIDEALKGEPGSEVEIVQLGGTAVHPVLRSEIRMEASGFTSLETGEFVMLFMTRDQRNQRHLVAGAQGKFVIEVEETGDETVAVAPKRLQVVRSEGRAVLLEGRPMTLDALKERVAGRLASQRAEAQRRNPGVQTNPEPGQ